MELTKKELLLVLGVVLIGLYYYGPNQIPYSKHLPLIGGGAFALNFVANLINK